MRVISIRDVVVQWNPAANERLVGLHWRVMRLLCRVLKHDLWHIGCGIYICRRCASLGTREVT